MSVVCLSSVITATEGLWNIFCVMDSMCVMVGNVLLRGCFEDAHERNSDNMGHSPKFHPLCTLCCVYEICGR